ncbi:lipocalin-like domain-containing protein [Methylobacterium sp. A54F]
MMPVVDRWSSHYGSKVIVPISARRLCNAALGFVASTAFVLTALGLGTSAGRALEVDEVVGTWRLAAATRRIVDTGETIDAYGGPRPTGWINYGRDGRMMVVCAHEGRDRPVANDRMTDADRVKLHKTFFAYAGSYRLEGDRIVHDIDTSWNEAWTGTSQVRQVERKDGQLVLTTTPFKFNLDGRMSVITLIWTRYP